MKIVDYLSKKKVHLYYASEILNFQRILVYNYKVEEKKPKPKIIILKIYH